MSNNQGQQAERQAEQYLKKQGLILRQRNFSCRYGEIDLIMQDQDTLIFVEVRLRRSNRFGGAAASVTTAKQKRLRYSAQYYLQQHQLDMPCRFDVLASNGDSWQWIPHAFDD